MKAEFDKLREELRVERLEREGAEHEIRSLTQRGPEDLPDAYQQ